MGSATDLTDTSPARRGERRDTLPGQGDRAAERRPTRFAGQLVHRDARGQSPRGRAVAPGKRFAVQRRIRNRAVPASCVDEDASGPVVPTRVSGHVVEVGSDQAVGLTARNVVHDKSQSDRLAREHNRFCGAPRRDPSATRSLGARAQGREHQDDADGCKGKSLAHQLPSPLRARSLRIAPRPADAARRSRHTRMRARLRCEKGLGTSYPKADSFATVTHRTLDPQTLIVNERSRAWRAASRRDSRRRALSRHWPAAP